jgi:CMP-N-acetylneuraminic acid synthetase
MTGKGLAVIPARAGSKRLPDKNVRPLGGHPLIAWTLRAALASPELGRVYVSTDSPDYAAVAKRYGAEAPFLRSARAASDQAPTAEVVVEAVERYEKELGYAADWVSILQPTSPFRSPATIARGIRAFLAAGGNSVVAVARRKIPRGWMLDVDAQGDVVDATEEGPELPPYYYCGAFYALRVETLKKTGGLYTDKVRCFVVEDPAEALDIDTPEDWSLAERLAPSFREAFFGPADQEGGR